MCFSSSASFGASAVLSVASAVSFAYARTRPQRFLAGIPLIFAIQQFTEGVLWMALLNPAWAHWERPATYSFLIFAQTVWPIYIPLCMLLFEQKPLKKKIIAALMFSGILLSAYTGFCLWHFPVHAIAEKHHIRYELGFPLAQRWYYGLLYFLPTIISPIITSDRKLHWLGYLFLIAYIVARLLFHYFEISVWCFFGALISSIVLIIIISSNRKDKAA